MRPADPTLHIRRAVEADVPDLVRIRFAVRENRLSDPSRVPPSLVVAYLEDRGRGWVATRDGVPLGFAFGARDGSVWALFVLPEAEGQGVGARLFDEVEAWLFALGHAELRLSTEPGSRAEGFYAARGWTRGGMTLHGEVVYTRRQDAA